MIDNRLEYQRMFEVEQQLWWYQVLHERVLKQINQRSKPQKKDPAILDAACGTGGLLSYLRKNGFQNLSGFDYSQHAIDFANERDLNVTFGDLKNMESYSPGQMFDVICCNDALYFLSDHEIINALQNFKNRLNPNGLIIINIHAFEAFSGIHDLAVGSQRRFTMQDFNRYSNTAGLKITYNTYWPFLLSLPILAVRQWQNYQIRRNAIDVSQVDSDVKYPGDLINSVLRAVTKTEAVLLKKAPFGSSLFMVLQPK
ncbi:bifunctional 2-polyprenyl-6-hydroxyphenol methylase/3-demethylubiquinol 3-O-methyltransferase UbiG [Dyadobacter sp. CY343]|uniref:class I SAM-dependent methyltransferase n=1 Tax=Dyadobacter sp. CY343 TaxID=2907299 RepID=UPI001F48B3D6|nr:class I SAM-dependent methyltransferase [Dyadobacter sp. CY343]MCE7063420.1 class I SAM-dependent methyltransferase [Dyadobacter sp. CY343]